MARGKAGEWCGCQLALKGGCPERSEMRNTLFKSAMPMALLLSSAARMPMPFDPGKAGWKLTEDGKAIELKDGNPVWINADGSEAVMQGDAITRLNAENKDMRQRAEAAETKAKAFDGLDAAAAKDALAKLQKIDQKKLIDAGEVDKLKDSMKQEFTGQIAELQKDRDTLQQRLDQREIDFVFAGSEFIRDRVAIPRDLFEGSMRKHFSMKDGKLEIKDASGNVMRSKKNIGEIASPDEALEMLIDMRPDKDAILKANTGGGSGNNGGGGNRGNNGATIKRADWEKLPAHEQAAKSTALVKGELTVVD
jgi:hypothetical protein